MRFISNTRITVANWVLVFLPAHTNGLSSGTQRPDREKGEVDQRGPEGSHLDVGL